MTTSHSTKRDQKKLNLITLCVYARVFLSTHCHLYICTVSRIRFGLWIHHHSFRLSPDIIILRCRYAAVRIWCTFSYTVVVIERYDCHVVYDTVLFFRGVNLNIFFFGLWQWLFWYYFLPRIYGVFHKPRCLLGVISFLVKFILIMTSGFV